MCTFLTNIFVFTGDSPFFKTRNAQLLFLLLLCCFPLTVVNPSQKFRERIYKGMVFLPQTGGMVGETVDAELKGVQEKCVVVVVCSLIRVLFLVSTCNHDKFIPDIFSTYVVFCLQNKFRFIQTRLSIFLERSTDMLGLLWVHTHVERHDGNKVVFAKGKKSVLYPLQCQVKMFLTVKN